MVFEAIINTTPNNFGNYTLNPQFAQHDDMDLSDWLAKCTEDCYSVEVNHDIDGRLEGQDGATIYKCSQSETEFVNVAVWVE